jgi:iron(III) transport system ATP-binding protein
VTLLPPSERNVSMVFQSYALFPHMTVIDNVAYGPTVSGAAKQRAREMAAEKISLLGFGGLQLRLRSRQYRLDIHRIGAVTAADAVVS